MCLHTCTAVARLTLALAKLSCYQYLLSTTQPVFPEQDIHGESLRHSGARICYSLSDSGDRHAAGDIFYLLFRYKILQICRLYKIYVLTVFIYIKVV